MNYHYLWRSDLPDSLNCDYTLDEYEFFKSILSPKDRFSYMTGNSTWNPTEEFINLGFEYQIYQDKKGRKAMQILYIYDQPAYSSSNISRGDFVQFLSKENNIVRLKKIKLNDDLFEYTSNQEEIVISLSDFGNSKSTVQLYKIIDDGINRIGYVCYLEYGEKKDIAKALKYFYENNITDLVLDLRYNPGGYVSTCKYICNCIVPEIGYSQIFQRCTYNDILAEKNFEETGSPDSFDFFETPQNEFGNSLGYAIYPFRLNRLYVLTSKNTASASEATIVCLRPFLDVTIIGETTVGKGVGSYNISDKKFRNSIQPITMQYYNARNETTPDEGLKPDYYFPNSYLTSKSDLGDPCEPLLNQALSLINNSFSSSTATTRSISNFENNLIPIGEPSFVSEFRLKPHFN